MPKGKMPTTGWGPYRPTRSEPLQKLRDALLSELEQRRADPNSQFDHEAVWQEIDLVCARYLGQKKSGLPPTAAQRDEKIQEILYCSDILYSLLSNEKAEILNQLNRSLRKQGGDLFELKKQLGILIEFGYPTEFLNLPRSRPDPFVEWLVRDLIEIWHRATGSPPRKTGTDHYKDVRTSPFFRWANQIAKVVVGKNFPRDLVDELVGQHRSDDQSGPDG